jgi:hypothetical protein
VNFRALLILEVVMWLVITHEDGAQIFSSVS